MRALFHPGQGAYLHDFNGRLGDSKNDIMLYSVVEAESHEAAARSFEANIFVRSVIHCFHSVRIFPSTSFLLAGSVFFHSRLQVRKFTMAPVGTNPAEAVFDYLRVDSDVFPPKRRAMNCRFTHVSIERMG